MFDGIQVNSTQSNKKNHLLSQRILKRISKYQEKEGNIKRNLIMSLKSKLKVEFMLIIIFLFVDV